MAEQNYRNHTKWDPYFHFFLVPVLIATLVFTIKHALAYPNGVTLWLCLLSVALIVWLVRTRVYSLKLQDRLIRLEERLRFEKLVPSEMAGRFDELTLRQVVALRFASDAEFAEVARRAIEERLSPKQIKAAIKQWRPDNLRV